MPLYQQIIVTLPLFENNLVPLFRRHATTILQLGGTVRAVENHGVRHLPHRATRKYAATDGTRHFWKARYTTVTFDASPATLREAERILRNDESVLRFFNVKQVSNIDKCNTRTWKNPYLRVQANSPDTSN